MLNVLPWAGPKHFAAAVSKAVAGSFILCIATPDTRIRDTARKMARQALREALGVLLDRPPESLPLISEPGHPIRLDISDPKVGLSISHESGLTLAAIHLNGAVGIDLMRVDQHADWLTDWEPIARDYLGTKAAERIALHPRTERPHAFAREWTRLEAGLKCLGMQLQEWSPALESELMRCELIDLDAPEGFVATMAALSESRPG